MKSALLAVPLLAGALLSAETSGDPARPPIRFRSERIKLFVQEYTLRVEGTYDFANPDSIPHEQALYYPFPLDDLHPRVTEIVVRSGDSTIPTRRGEDGVGFAVSIPAGDSVAVSVSYEQLCLDNSGCYILTTTARWKAPLERADFEIHVPNGIGLEWVAYEADTVVARKGSRVYEFSRRDFQPDRDLCLRWRTGGKD
jgi:hypothetical protein